MKSFTMLPRFCFPVIDAVRPHFPWALPHFHDHRDGAAQPDATDSGSSSINLVFGSFGDDRLTGSVPLDYDDLDLGTRDLILGLSGSDTIFGTFGQDTLIGGSGDDVIRTDAAPDAGLPPVADFSGDMILAGRGNDDVLGSFGDDTIFGGAGNDVIWGEPIQASPGSPGGNDRIYGGRGDDTVDGGVGDDLIRGGQGNDDLSGSVGDDTLNGGKGDDVITGGPGDDLMIGGPGSDSFLFFDAFASPGAGVVTNGDDVILDFGPKDRLLTRTALDDPDGDGVIPLSPDGILQLPAAPSQFIPGGTVTIDGTSELVFTGEELIGGASYFVYELL